MTKFKIDTAEILKPQDWGFPVPISYGPGRLVEIGKACASLEIKNPLIVTDSGSKELPFIEKLKKFKGYIFCEKPPAVSIKELNQIKKGLNKLNIKPFINNTGNFLLSRTGLP